MSIIICKIIVHCLYSAYSAYCYMQNMQNMHKNMQKYVNEYAEICTNMPNNMQNNTSLSIQCIFCILLYAEYAEYAVICNWHILHIPAYFSIFQHIDLHIFLHIPAYFLYWVLKESSPSSPLVGLVVCITYAYWALTIFYIKTAMNT